MTFLTIISYLGIFMFALAGAFKARGAKLDIFGGLVVAFVSAYGGGTLRDLLLGVRPLTWINDNLAFGLVFAGTAVTFLVKDKVNNFRRTIFFTDAMGIGLFTAVGIETALQNGTNNLYSLIMGIITATFGGLIADIFCGYPPLLLRKGELYATACAAGGLAFILINKYFDFNRSIDLSICVVLVVAIRIYSKRKRLTLPEI
ncbi:trimeric intracellular cation channel family protein [Niabella hibiscisoli]|uniref:trimeric intracellular cation channel family protein n=1 Tax=Niabella hibiscisoli TaxID=1825928 RepID=UPI001F0D993A|nr:trimeric intracellular cation channel family protein [Niabella hibiscisoli]MCH5715499.1 trimeric intracellular cation channel family protein [Niabella hibiscisoli]